MSIPIHHQRKLDLHREQGKDGLSAPIPQEITGTSHHRVGKKMVEVERVWQKEHVLAGYHQQEFGEHSHDEHDLLGEHETRDGRLLVEHLEEDLPGGCRGPVFKLTHSRGHVLTVLCADVVRKYISGDY